MVGLRDLRQSHTGRDALSDLHRQLLELSLVTGPHLERLDLILAQVIRRSKLLQACLLNGKLSLNALSMTRHAVTRVGIEGSGNFGWPAAMYPGPRPERR